MGDRRASFRKRAHGSEESHAARAAQRKVDLGPQGGQRGSQLVARIAHEAPLARDRPLQAVQHRVQRVAEGGNLVALRRNRQSLGEFAFGDSLGPLAHPVDGSQGGPREFIPGKAGEQQGQRPGDEQQRSQPGELVIAKIEWLGDRDHARGAGSRARRQGVDPGRS